MAHWNFNQHLEAMRAAGVTFLPRAGDGSSENPWRELHGGALTRDVDREQRAIENYEDRHPTAYADMLRDMAESLPAMEAECRISVLLPCRNEVQHIETMLRLLTEQYGWDGGLLPRNSYEVLVLVNTRHGEPRDATSELARRWRHPAGLHLHVIDHVHPPGETSPLTMARKILADLSLWRSARRTGSVAPLYLACEDADGVWIDPYQLTVMIEALDNDPGLDCVRGQQDRCPWDMVKHPMLFLMRRSWNFCEAHAARRSLRPERNPDYNFNWSRVVTSGWNTAFSAEVYARILGYTKERLFEEDMDIGEKISCLRATPFGNGLLPQVNTTGAIHTRAEGSLRRWYYRIAEGIEPYDDADDYDNFHSHRHESIIKTSRIDALSQAIAPRTALISENIPLLREMLQRDLDFQKVNGRSLEKGCRDYRRILSLLGFRPGETGIDDTGRLEINALGGVSERFNALVARQPVRPIPHWLMRTRSHRRSWHGLWGQLEAKAAPEKAYRVGLVGCGRIVEEGHVPAYATRTGTIRIACLADPSQERRDRIGDLLGVPPSTRFEDLSELLASGVDGVVIATPSGLHFEAAKQALEAGLDVLVEKPLTIGSLQLRELLSLSEARSTRLGCLHNYLSSDLWRTALKFVRLGELGPTRRLLVTIRAPEPLPGFSPADPSWRLRTLEGGRGCLLDQGYHFFYLAEALFGAEQPKMRVELGHSGRAGREVEDSVRAIFDHGDGCETVLVIDWNHDQLEPAHYVIECAKGRLLLDEDEQTVTIEKEQETRQVQLGVDDEAGYQGQLLASLEAFAAGAGPVTNGEAALRTLTWIEAAYDAVEETG